MYSYPRILVLDTAVGSKNLGDQIIMDSVYSELRSIFPHAFVTNSATHDYLGPESTKLMEEADLIIVGGTNLLSSNMHKVNQWKVTLRDTFRLKNAVLMGVGWWQYQGRPNWYTRLLLKRILSDGCIHAVRDSYSREKLLSCGVSRVENTSCVTAWCLSPETVSKIPQQKADHVVATLTDYSPKLAQDAQFLESLIGLYSTVNIWLQGSRDYGYAKQVLGSRISSVRFIDSSLVAYDEFLSSHSDLDYVGTRLHAGIRALQSGKRALIVNVDNRSAEISKDINIHTVARGDSQTLEDKITGNRMTELSLPIDSINRWKEQLQVQLRREQ